METTRLSTKGQVTLPMRILESRSWRPGTELVVEETAEGVLLRPAARFAPTKLDDVVGCLPSERRANTPAQMRAAVAQVVKERHSRGVRGPLRIP